MADNSITVFTNTQFGKLRTITDNKGQTYFINRYAKCEAA